MGNNFLVIRLWWEAVKIRERDIEAFLCTYFFLDQENIKNNCPFDRLSDKPTVQGLRGNNKHFMF